MTFRQFKKITFNYFIKHMCLKKRVLKKMLKYKLVGDNWAGDAHCQVGFIFKGQKLILDYWLNRWDLLIDTIRGVHLCNIGKTIEQCCDYLWKIGEKNE